MLTRAISFLNSLVIKLKDNDVGLPEHTETELAQSNFAALSNQTKSRFTTQGSSTLQDVVELPDGNKATIDAEGKVEVVTPAGDKVATSDESYKKPIKKAKPPKTIDTKKVVIAVGGVAVVTTIGFMIVRRNK